MCLAPIAHAEQHGAAYAAIKAAIDYCSRVDEQHRAQYLALGSKTLASVSGEGDTADYQAVYDSVSASLKKTPETAGRKACTAAIGLQHTAGHGDR
jgi:hypothetical protein